MKVLIAGASGQIGSALLRCSPATANVVGVNHRDLDIAYRSAVLKCLRHHRPETVINVAAYTAVDRAESEAELARQVNEEGAHHLASAAQELGARLIHVSTDFVFDGAASTRYRPQDAPNPLSVYGRTKLGGERRVSQSLPGRSLILRTAWVYGPGARHNFVRTMLRLMRERGAVRVVADQIGTPTAASSVAGAIWEFVARPQLSGIFHWTDSGVASWYDFAVAIAEEAAALGQLPLGVSVIPIATADFPAAAIRPRFSVLDTSAAIAAIGCTPAHWRQNLRITLQEMRNG